MLSVFQSSFTGALANRDYLDVTSNNLANLNTTAFRGSRPEFSDRLYLELSADNVGLDEDSKVIRPEVGTGSTLVATSLDLSPGSLALTDDPLDLAIVGRGFFPVTQSDGTTAYTRDGSFILDSNRNVLTSSGYLLEPPLVVPAAARAVRITPEGQVNVDVPDPENPGETIEETIGTIQLAVFSNERGLHAVGSNLFVETAASGSPSVVTPGQQNAGELRSFAVETSNVDTATEMTNLIMAQRAYQLSLRAMRQMDEMLAIATRLRRG
jgi:flagellar basal-body rod protein FlgG